MYLASSQEQRLVLIDLRTENIWYKPLNSRGKGVVQEEEGNTTLAGTSTWRAPAIPLPSIRTHRKMTIAWDFCRVVPIL